MYSHWDKGQFKAVFGCPECTRTGKEANLIEDYEDWRFHCAAVHSRAVPTAAAIETTRARKSRMRTRCLICDEHFWSLPAHLTRIHEAQGLFDRPFQCPECARARESDDSPWIESRQAWLTYCASTHRDVSSTLNIQQQSVQRKGVEGSYEDQELSDKRKGGELRHQSTCEPAAPSYSQRQT